jgi:hypothetical protein
MAIQYSTPVRNAELDAIETTISTAPTLTIVSGAAPADCATANSGTILVTMTLPSDWMAAASAGSKALAGVWQDASADAAGTAAHFRIHAGVVCHIQGTVTATSGGGDMELDNTNIASGQQVTVSTFTVTAGNA